MSDSTETSIKTSVKFTRSLQARSNDTIYKYNTIDLHFGGNSWVYFTCLDLQTRKRYMYDSALTSTVQFVMVSWT